MWVTELEGGTLTSSAGDLMSLLVRLLGVFGCSGGGERGGEGELVVGTLLGPEGTGRPVAVEVAGSGCCLTQGLMLVVPPTPCPGFGPGELVWGLAVGLVGCLSVR
jgi:hypothetical protein